MKKSKESVAQKREGKRPERADLIFLATGLFFAALPYVFPTDYIFFRFVIYSFIGFQFGSRAGLLSTLPTAIAVFIKTPAFVYSGAGSLDAYLAMIYSAPVLGWLAGQVKKHIEKLERFTPLIWISGLGLALLLYYWTADKPRFIQVLFLFLAFVTVFFIWKYRQNLTHIKSFFWLLIFYYILSFLFFFIVTRFGGSITTFYNSLLYLLPADVLAVFLAAVLAPQMDGIIRSFEKSKRGYDL